MAFNKITAKSGAASEAPRGGDNTAPSLPPLVPLSLSAPPRVAGVLGAMARTEDLAFSPSGRRLAVAGFGRNRIFLFALGDPAGEAGDRKSVTIEGCAVIAARCLRDPHGVAFIGEDHLITANRSGFIHVLKIPHGAESASVREVTLRSRARITGGDAAPVYSPGSITCLEDHERGADDVTQYRLFACNNYIDTVTAHTLHFGPGDAIATGNVGVMLNWGLAIPDGISISPDQRWMAVSNHCNGTVLVFDMAAGLSPDVRPAAILHGIVCPHAVRFLPGGDRLLVADSASEYVHLYRQPGDAWRGMQAPTKSLRLLDEATFARGRYNAQEGGIKGIDIDPTGKILSAACEHLPLAFFDLATLMEAAGEDAAMAIQEKVRLRDAEISAGTA